MNEETPKPQITPETEPTVSGPPVEQASDSQPYDFATLRGFLGGMGERQGVAALRETLEEWVTEDRERERKRDAADVALRAFFTQELERLRSAIQVELRIRAAQQVLRDLLPLLNDLDEEIRQLESPSGESPARTLAPLLNTRRRIYTALRKLGLEQIPVTAKETDFDPELHECVETTEATGDPGPLPPGRILALKRNGYFFRGELYQAPQVIIAGGK